MKIYEYEFLVKKILGVDEERILQILEDKDNAYDTFEIPKRHGVRCIHGLNKEAGVGLKNIQRNLYKNFLGKIPLAVPAKGFKKGENYQAFLQKHIGSMFFMRVDISNFFDSFTEGIIKDTLANYVKDDAAVELIFELCTVKGRLPQGALTSPVLSNIIFARIDQRILKYCQTIEERHKENRKRKEHNWETVSIHYTRYADDLLFSSNFFDFRSNISFFRMIVKILGEFNFTVNRQKTIMCDKKLAMNGYVVDDCIHLSRAKLRKIKRILYYFRDECSAEYKLNVKRFTDQQEIIHNVNQLNRQYCAEQKGFENIRQLIYYLSGCRSWLISVIQTSDNGNRKLRDTQKLICRIEMVLDELEKLEE